MQARLDISNLILGVKFDTRYSRDMTGKTNQIYYDVITRDIENNREEKNKIFRPFLYAENVFLTKLLH